MLSIYFSNHKTLAFVSAFVLHHFQIVPLIILHIFLWVGPTRLKVLQQTAIERETENNKKTNTIDINNEKRKAQQLQDTEEK